MDPKNNSHPTLLCSLLLCLPLVGLALSGCDEGGDWRDPGPDDVLERFVTHWYLEEREEVLALVAPEDRAQIEAAHRELQAMKVPEEARPRLEEMLELGWVVNPYTLRKAQVLEKLEGAPKPGQRVKVKIVRGDGEEAMATMVWSGERWFVDLPLEEQAQGAPAGATVDEEGVEGS